MKSTLPTLSVIIHTKNDEHNIKECILSLPPFTTEIVVVDMQSSDNTVQIAKKLGAKILMVQDFGVAEPTRNQGIDAATSTWVLVVDSDERVPVSLHNTIKKILISGTYDAVLIPRKNLMLGKWIKHSMRWPDYQKRLFKKGSVQWSDVIHAPPTHTGELLQLPALEKNAFVDHHSQNLHRLLEKTILQASQERYYDSLSSLHAHDVYNRLTQEFPWREFEHEGYKDGLHGFVTNKFMEIYRTLEFCFFWERTGYKNLFSQQEIIKTWDTTKRIQELETELTIIKSSKIYKFWTAVQQLKKNIHL